MLEVNQEEFNQKKIYTMKLTEFKKLSVGTKVTDGEREGTVVKISTSRDKALVLFKDGFKEWIDFYNIETL